MINILTILATVIGLFYRLYGWFNVSTEEHAEVIITIIMLLLTSYWIMYQIKHIAFLSAN